MSDQKMQECFEFFYDLKWEQVNDFAQQAWKAAWQASRECLVIELPESFEFHDPYEDGLAISACKESILISGVKIK